MSLSPELLTRLTRLLTLTVAILGTLLTVTSCGGPRQPPETDIPGYEQLRDKLGDYNFSPLRDRRIVLDPGHGGRYRGAVGLNGLTEAEVNLGVALYLRGLLEWAGARVYLTRTADYDLLAPSDSSLTEDLAARVAFSDSLQPDVFISIHHNSNAELDRDLNETQTYYPVGREGADLDLARSIHKYLVRNLEIEPAKIMAGNFYVLRNATVPAVLGEPSMISNPVIEKRLSLAAKQELEAQAYFLGMLEYFAGGTPTFGSSYGDTVHWEDHPDRWLSWIFAGGDSLAPGLDPATVEFSLDGRKVPVTVEPDGRTVTWYPAEVDLQANHFIELRARNLKGRATPLLQLHVAGAIAGTPTFASRIILEDPGRSDPLALFVWRSLGRPLPDLPPLYLARNSGGDRCGTPIARLGVFPGHEGWLLLPAELVPLSHSDELSICRDLGGQENPSFLATSLQPVFHQLPATYRWAILARQPGFWPESPVPGEAVTRRLGPTESGQASAFPLAGYPTWPVIPLPDDKTVWLEAAGALPIVTAPARQPSGPQLEFARPDTFWWHPVLPDLIGKVIVLDPTGGGSESDGTGPLGTRGAELNLRVAEMTATLLRGAGAHAVLTRNDESWVPPTEKVLLTNRRQADLFLTIGRSNDPAHFITAHHHHGSAVGSRWADFFARAAAPLLGQISATGDSSVAVTPSYAYLLRHTACPALIVGLEPLFSLASEELQSMSSYQQSQARALFLSIAAVWVGAELLDRQIDLGSLLASGQDLVPARQEIEWVKWDGNFPWHPPSWSATPGDSVSFPVTPGLPAESDRHYLEIRTRTEWQLWTLVSTARGNWAWQKLLSDTRWNPPATSTATEQGVINQSNPPVQPKPAGGSHP